MKDQRCLCPESTAPSCLVLMSNFAHQDQFELLRVFLVRWACHDISLPLVRMSMLEYCIHLNDPSKHIVSLTPVVYYRSRACSCEVIVKDIEMSILGSQSLSTNLQNSWKDDQNWWAAIKWVHLRLWSYRDGAYLSTCRYTAVHRFYSDCVRFSNQQLDWSQQMMSNVFIGIT